MGLVDVDAGSAFFDSILSLSFDLGVCQFVLCVVLYCVVLESGVWPHTETHTDTDERADLNSWRAWARAGEWGRCGKAVEFK